MPEWNLLMAGSHFIDNTNRESIDPFILGKSLMEIL